MAATSFMGRSLYSRCAAPVRRDFRKGDVLHSLADIGKARQRLGYAPAYRVGEGLALSMAWYIANPGLAASP